MRYRVSIMGKEIELRGYVDDQLNLVHLAEAVRPLGMVIASPAEPDYNPFSQEVTPPARPSDRRASHLKGN